MTSVRIREAIALICSKPDPDRRAKIVRLARSAADAAETGRVALDPILDELETLTGHRDNSDYWASFHGGNGPDEFADINGSALPEPIPSLTLDEIRSLLELEARARESQHYDGATSIRLHSFLSASLGHAFTTDLIFHPYGEWDREGLAAEIIRRRSVINSGGAEALAKHEASSARSTLGEGTAPAAILSIALEMLAPEERGAYESALEAKYQEEVEAARVQRRDARSCVH